MNYYELNPEENTFHTLCVDITHRCNMNCVNCYIPNRNIPDMDIIKLQQFLLRLPKRTDIRIIGAEPTVRKDLPQIIAMVRKLGHRPTLNTNGLKLANADYVKRLFDSGLRSVSISMNGADSDLLYMQTDNLICAKKKIKALENCIKKNLYVNINCLIMKGVNESAIPRLLEIAKSFNVKLILRFRNVAELGRYSKVDNQNYTFDELINLIGITAGVDPEEIKKNNVVQGYEEEHNVLFNVPNTLIKIKITDWAPNDSIIPDPNSTRRGRITENFKIAPFFEHVKINEFNY